MASDNSRRDFLKKASALVLGSMAASTINNKMQGAVDYINKIDGSSEQTFSLPELPYTYDALEPHIDKLTMEIHHSKHHQGYVNKLNAALDEYDKIDRNLDVIAGVRNTEKLMKIFKHVDKLSDAIRNNAGGHYNHSLFWTLMQDKGMQVPRAELATAINANFGSYEAFKKQFTEIAMKRFGSGWAWLIKSDDKLVITSTANQDNPLMQLDTVEQKGTPILALDVWEHAYYLKNQNRRGDYINSWWNVVNWVEAGKLFLKA